MRPPVTFDPLTALLEHSHWAMRRVLALCAGLSPAQFHQRFDIGPGSLQDTLRHIIHNMRAWADDIAPRDARPSLANLQDRHTPAELANLLDDATEDLRVLIEQSRGRLHEHVHVTFRKGGPRFTFTRGVALTHVLVHGTHHRAQCLNMLRRLDLPDVSDRLPDIDLNEWQTETECKP
jgi:uncharacterized damage-inducible protein DinB